MSHLAYVPLALVLWLGALGITTASAQMDAASVAPAAPVASVQPAPSQPGPFTAYRPEADFARPMIVNAYPSTGPNADALEYLREGLRRMTGQEYHLRSTTDLSSGIIMVLMQDAPAELRDDPQVQQALAADPNDPYAANEAFYIRSESNRVVLIANKLQGLVNAAVTLLESVGYEVLGMGPNWIHVPDHRQTPLVFDLNLADRPSFYSREQWVAGGQAWGVGTISIKMALSDPADEAVEVSYRRWRIGARMATMSMPPFPGHALQAYHNAVIGHIQTTGEPQGFVAKHSLVSTLDQRPAASEENKGWFWIDSQPAADPKQPLTFISDGKEWKPTGGTRYVDVSVPAVRQFILQELIKRATAAFEKNPDEAVVFGIDPEDGLPGDLANGSFNPNWYPEYRAAEGLPFGRDYLLHGHYDLDQPKEQWDPGSDSNRIYGLADWLLHEFDKWVDALPADQQVTASGKSKKSLVRCSFYSYNGHDVPPSFNPDPRTRVMVCAGYAMNTGRGKWMKLAKTEDIIQAMQIMLPREPAGIYLYSSVAPSTDLGLGNIATRRNAAPAAVAEQFRRYHEVGVRAFSAQGDFNFGKLGLMYYLYSKMLWNVKLDGASLDALRDRWFQRAYGSAWRQMKAYYDFMLPSNFGINGLRSWGIAVQLIEEADQALDGDKEPDAQRRLDDVKQFWYHYYLTATGKVKKESPELKEFLWKGQMSYMTPMFALVWSVFNTYRVSDAVGPELAAGPAHYTHEETQAWWKNVLAQWPVAAVTDFANVTLANGKPAKTADLNDLVMVSQFQSPATPDVPFRYDGPGSIPIPILTIARRAGDPIGFTLAWPYTTAKWYGRNDRKDLSYGVDIWDPATQSWDPWIDRTTTKQMSEEAQASNGDPLQVLAVRLKAPRPGTYRFEFDAGGYSSWLASAAFDPTTNAYAGACGFTYAATPGGYTQSPTYFYIPKGTKTLDLEVWDNYKKKILTLYQGLPSANPKESRQVDISTMGTHTIALQPGESGTVAKISGNGLGVPFFYSVPTLWAKSPGALLVPRAIAKADGLTILH